MNPPHPQRNTHALFPAVISVSHHGDSDWNRELHERIHALRDDATVANAVTRRDIATKHGYQPDLDLVRHWVDDPAWQAFLDRCVHPDIQAHLAEHARIAGWPPAGTGYRFAASWAVLYPAGAYQAPHLHRDRFCVLAYYPRVPLRPEPEGAISFINPHPESQYPTTHGWAYEHRIQPRNGTSIVFPGWLQHFSHPHQGSDERLLLTFDVDLLPPRR
jgi:uncharacterized protein (TIGR02466 family)